MTTIANGTEKQIEFANDIKREYVSHLTDAANSDRADVSCINTHLLAVLERQGSADAKTWIDSRDKMGVVDARYFLTLRRFVRSATVQDVAKAYFLLGHNDPFRVIYGVERGDRDAATTAAEDLIAAVGAADDARRAAKA